MKLIDVHVHLGSWMFPIPPVSPEQLLTAMDRFQIEQSIVSSSSAILYDFRAGNRELLEMIHDHPRLWGYIVVNPNYPEESLAELEKYWTQPRFLGVKFHPEQHAYAINNENAMRILHKVGTMGKPILVHTFGREQVSNLGAVAAAFPELTVIMAHMGGDAWQEGITAAARYPNLYLEPCSSFADSDKIGAAVRAIGADRILFGSDATLLHPGFTFGMLRDASITESQRELIAAVNARRIFHLT